MDDRVYKIYALSGPDMAVRYVGMTTQALAARTRGHIGEDKQGKTPKGRWLQEVGDSLVVRELDRFEWEPGGETPMQRERRWIDKFREEGCDLFNRERRAKKPPFTVIELDQKDEANEPV